jgi:5-bromo-4-chloroindolyl phosphate hydrolysis protein
LIQRLLRAVIFTLLALIGVVMAIIFTVSTVLAMLVLIIVSAVRGKRFEVKEYWMNRQARRKSILDKGSLRPKDVTDVDARDIK